VDQASALVALPLIIFSTVEPYVFAQTMAWITRRLTKEPAPAPPSVAQMLSLAAQLAELERRR
jgi:hypothetical protein